jgi:hypothetical protein
VGKRISPRRRTLARRDGLGLGGSIAEGEDLNGRDGLRATTSEKSLDKKNARQGVDTSYTTKKNKIKTTERCDNFQVIALSLSRATKASPRRPAPV